MIRRIINLSTSNSFFLFGARGTGKSTLLRQQVEPRAAISIDLLLPSQFDRLLRDPKALLAQIEALEDTSSWVIIDEVQKIPALLDLVHYAIERFGTRFALTGSSARKLRRGEANLLAGRAFVYHLYPFTHQELGDRFDLKEALELGTLPKVCDYDSREDQELFLTAYAHTYLKEEIQAEQVVRALAPFRRFIEVAAQMNGALINFSAVARDVGVDDKTVKGYFQILEDTLLGFFLPAYHKSVRKTQLRAPRFYFFDCGVKRAIEGTISNRLVESTSGFGQAFEHFLIAEIMRLNSYYRKNFRLFYLRTQAGVEIDLIIERPGDATVLLEIKSTTAVRVEHLQNLQALATQFQNPLCLCLSRDQASQRFGSVLCLPWQKGLMELGLC